MSLLLAKARGVERGFPQFIFDIFTAICQEAGPDYIPALITTLLGHEPPAGIDRPGRHALQSSISSLGKSLAMAQPITDGQVTMTTARRRRSTSIRATSRPS